MAVGFPAKTTFADGTTLSAGDLNDITGTLNSIMNGGGYSAIGGLQLIKTQTIGSAVSSVTVSSAFSATYDSYKIIFHGGTMSATGSIRASLGGITTGYYSNLIYSNFGTTTPTGANTSNSSSWNYVGAGNTTSANGEFDLHNPFATKVKWGRSSYMQLTSAGDCGTGSFIQGLTTSCTDLTILPSTGTLTGGTIYVYGYQKS